MTKEQRAAARERCERAEKGPWYLDADSGSIEATGGGCVGYVQHHGNINTVARTGEAFSHADGEFIANARTDLPAALDTIDALEAENAKLRELLAPFRVVADVVDSMPEDHRLGDGRSARPILPACWPTIGDCRRVRDALEESHE